MTFATSHSNRLARRGFSLTEILVVIGIIVVIAGILAPTLLRAYKQANNSKGQYDLQAIGVGLEAYKQDFGDYPRTISGTTDTGSHTLCQALFAPGAVADDGADGLGFRIRPGGAGKVWGPYLQTDRFILDSNTIAGDAVNYATVMVYTKDYTPILYYPAAPTKPDITIATKYCWVNPIVGVPPLYNASDNSALMPAISLYAELGDYSTNGAIDSAVATETAATEGPYLLIATGPDGNFGPSGIVAGGSITSWTANKKAVQDCDDITNFPR